MELKLSDTKEYILCAFIYVKFKYRQNASVEIEISKSLPLGGKGIDGKGPERNVLWQWF